MSDSTAPHRSPRASEASPDAPAARHATYSGIPLEPVYTAARPDAAGFGAAPTGLWGAATEVSRGKDTPSGHWEIAGVPVPFDWTYFPDERPAFPRDVTAALIEAGGAGGDGERSAGARKNP